MPLAEMFCTGCNAKVRVAPAVSRCPVCEGSLHPISDAEPADRTDLDRREAIEAGPGVEVDPLIGTRLGGYRIDALAGTGGMARVYRATDVTTGRIGAVKVMAAALVKDRPAAVRMFLQEARTVARLHHPHIVAIYGAGQCGAEHYLVMEYIPGPSLMQRIVQEGPLAPVPAATILLQVAAGLGAAHRIGIIHRDVKPANVLLTEQGVAKLADFGLAQAVIGRRSLAAGARGYIQGTPYFMAPELFAGFTADPRSDLYALGVMFYYMLTARFPYSAATLPELAEQHRSAPIPDPRLVDPAIPLELSRVIDRCLAKNPAERWSSAAELIEELEGALGRLRDMASVVQDAITALDAPDDRIGDRFQVVVAMAPRPARSVYLEVIAGAAPAERQLSIYAVCGPAEPAGFERAQRLHATIGTGTLRVREIDGQWQFVVQETLDRKHCDPALVCQMVRDLARCAGTLDTLLRPSGPSEPWT